MTSLTFTECCQRLSVTPKTLRQWLTQAEMSLHPHPTDIHSSLRYHVTN
jgi:transposase-like protein